MKKIFILLLFASFIIHCEGKSPKKSNDHLYTVVRILDGDTFVASDGNVQFKVRIVGVDTPESTQPYGKLAKEALKNLIANKKVELKPIEKPIGPFNRILAHVFADDHDIALTLIEKGLGYYYRPTCKDYPLDQKKYNYEPAIYVAAESKAKKQKLNLWSQPTPELPCDVRNHKKKPNN